MSAKCARMMSLRTVGRSGVHDDPVIDKRANRVKTAPNNVRFVLDDHVQADGGGHFRCGWRSAGFEDTTIHVQSFGLRLATASLHGNVAYHSPAFDTKRARGRRHRTVDGQARQPTTGDPRDDSRQDLIRGRRRHDRSRDQQGVGVRARRVPADGSLSAVLPEAFLLLPVGARERAIPNAAARNSR